MHRLKEKLLIVVLSLGLVVACAGCGETTSQDTGDLVQSSIEQTIENNTTDEQDTAASNKEDAATAENEEVSIEAPAREPVEVRIGSLKGPTSLGILGMMNETAGETFDNYQFQMATAADELLPLMIKGDLDIALVPANVAAVLYAKTEGQVAVVDINTLGVLYLVTGTAQVESIADLKGKTIYLTGKGTTPEASIRYLCSANGLAESDYTLEFKSEATEVAATLAANPDAIGLLPQPFVTAALLQNDALHVALDMNAAWMDANSDENGMVTGVTVVRKAFMEENPEVIADFLAAHKTSVDVVNSNVAQAAAWAVDAGIVAKEPIAMKAIPNCNLVCITGDELKSTLSAYLQVLADFDAKLVGGAVPNEDFYYISK